MAKAKKRRAKDIKAIGEFVIAFSQLEFAMRATFERMMGLTTEQSEVVLANYDFAALARAIGGFVGTLREQDGAASKRMDKLVSECLRINTERVRIVHGTWNTSGGASHMSRNSFKRAEYFAKLDDMVKLIASTNDAFDEFATIVVDKDEKWGPITKYLHDEIGSLRQDSQG